MRNLIVLRELKSILFTVFVVLVSFSVFGQEESNGCGGVLQHVYFNKGEFKLDDFDKKYLDTVAMFLNENKEVIFVMSGCTDSKGDSIYNLKLSKKRAKSVANYLHQKGVKKSRLELKWYGETRLLNLCSDTIECSEEMHQLNRRVEFVFVSPENPF
jgi:OOP family OmpA-OmpF porin